MAAFLATSIAESEANDETHLPPLQASASRPSAPVRGKLYTSHFLTTWNSRVFEFGAVLFLSSIFPGTLLPVSVYAVTRSASAILLSGAVGHFIDNAERMRVVRVSIGESRITIAQKR